MVDRCPARSGRCIAFFFHAWERSSSLFVTWSLLIDFETLENHFKFSPIFTQVVHRGRPLDPCVYRRVPGIMSASFIRALQAADQFLQQISHLPSLESAEQKQLRHLLLTVEKMQIGTEDAALMLESVNGSKNLSKNSKEALLQQIVEKSTADFENHVEAPMGRGKLQDFTGLCRFLPPALKGRLDNPGTTPSDSIALISQWSAALGLTTPSEPTLGVIVAIAYWKTWCEHGFVSDAAKHQIYLAQKKTIKDHLGYFQRQCPHVGPRLQKLPEQFENLPAGLRAHFAGENFGSSSKDIFFFAVDHVFFCQVFF